MFILFSLVFVFMSRCPISGAIMFASPHFRRERFEPGCSDGPGSPGTCPTEATAAAVVCCVRTEHLRPWPGRQNRTTWCRCQPPAYTELLHVLKDCLRDSWREYVASFLHFRGGYIHFHWIVYEDMVGFHKWNLILSWLRTQYWSLNWLLSSRVDFFLPTRRNISSVGYLALSKAQACYIIVICGVHWFLNLVVHFNLLEHLLKYRFSFSRSRVRPGCLHFQQTSRVFHVVKSQFQARYLYDLGQ